VPSWARAARRGNRTDREGRGRAVPVLSQKEKPGRHLAVRKIASEEGGKKRERAHRLRSMGTMGKGGEEISCLLFTWEEREMERPLLSRGEANRGRGGGGGERKVHPLKKEKN